MRCNIRSVKSTLRSVRPLNDPYGSNELNKPLTDRYNAGVLDNPVTPSIKFAVTHLSFFVQVLENLESPGILLSMAFSRTGKSWKKATGPGKFWKFVKLS